MYTRPRLPPLALTCALQAFSFLGGLFILFLVPETKGLTLEEMDEVFGSVGLAAADQARQEEINRTIGLSAYDNDYEKRDVDSYTKAEA